MTITIDTVKLEIITARPLLAASTPKNRAREHNTRKVRKLRPPRRDKNQNRGYGPACVHECVRVRVLVLLLISSLASKRILYAYQRCAAHALHEHLY